MLKAPGIKTVDYMACKSLRVWHRNKQARKRENAFSMSIATHLVAAFEIIVLQFDSIIRFWTHRIIGEIVKNFLEDVNCTP